MHRGVCACAGFHPVCGFQTNIKSLSPRDNRHSYSVVRLLRLFFLLPFLFAIASGAERFPRAEQFGSREALLEAYAAILQPMDFDYRQVGSVLEGLALAKFQAEHYPEPNYRILSGVQYFERGGRTIGELDLVVWSEREQRVIEVYEVKLSGNLDRAGAQAENQIKRFQHTLRQRKIDRMTTKVGAKRDLTARDFNGQVVYGLIGGSGAAQAGWAHEIDLTRAEGDTLQTMLLGRR